MDVTVSVSIYIFEDESSFVERKESHEIYREIYGDPIYDVYEDDEIYREICGDLIYDTYEDDVLNVDHVDFVFKEDVFRNDRANCVQKRRYSRSQEKQIYEDFGSCKIGADPVCEDFVQDPVRAKSVWKNRLRFEDESFLAGET
ncbi:unnamed protein product [Microthlaspi erraticum]|uniref:Uncharacterized protein n=1 Tax=Microthlaspi erraticum TaxID=1685480 RepID=A0A6D2HTZ4_9BRAS|nr:unnamed protein product [Microthlaspi erraticum]